jgi:hypothetical protein
MDGTPFRKLGDQNNLTGVQAYNKTKAELKALPNNFQLTKDLCDPKRFCGIIVIDGKYVAVKGFERKIPCIWALDYLSHDPIHGGLFVSEDEVSFSQFFEKLYDLNYQLRVVVADDRDGLKQALLKVFPYARLQLCHNHYLENIRKLLNIRTSDRYLHFFNSLKLHVFTEGNDEQKITNGLRYVMEKHSGHNRTLQNILFTINNRRIDLFNYLKFQNCPNTTNLIESYNSHLNGRLETIKGFQSFESAQTWLNGYLIRRRTKPFTDCKGKFKYLNKHCSLEFTIKKQATWPETLTKLGINIIKFFQKTD